MSYQDVREDEYREIPVATPGWEDAPVPGWGINPMRAGPPRVGVGEFYMPPTGMPGDDAVLPRYALISGLGVDPESAYKETSWGVVALAGAVGIGLGLLFGYAWWGQKGYTPNASWRRKRAGEGSRRARRRRWRFRGKENMSPNGWRRKQAERRSRRLRRRRRQLASEALLPNRDRLALRREHLGF